MRITLNGAVKTIDDDAITVAQLVQRYPPNHRAFAVEVNRRVIPRSEHKHHELRDGDVIEIVTLVGGG